MRSRIELLVALAAAVLLKGPAGLWADAAGSNRSLESARAPSAHISQGHPADRNADDDSQVGMPVLLSTDDIRPRYPLSSRLRREEGVVRITVTVDSGANAVALKLTQSSGYAALDNAALAAARKARFTSANASPLPPISEIVLTFRFSLR